ncbi:MAG: hypothetical protein Q9172_005367 [Xanthocarpia lactea]
MSFSATRKVIRNLKQRAKPEKEEKVLPEPTPPSQKPPDYSDFESFQSRLNALSQVSDFDSMRSFLSLYEPRGILLQELLILVSAFFHSPLGSHQDQCQWSVDGYRVPPKRSIRQVGWLRMLNEASSVQHLNALESELKSLRIIFVQYTALTDGASTVRDDFIAGRTWYMGSGVPPDRIALTAFNRDLSSFYQGMPDRDVHPCAERQREIYHYHGHIWISAIFQSDMAYVPNELKETIHDVAIQVLSHRYQGGDERIIGELQATNGKAIQDSLVVFHHSYQKVMLHLLEIRASVWHQKLQHGGRKPAFLEGELEFFQGMVRMGHRNGMKAWGMGGYALVELLGLAEISNDHRAVGTIVRLLEDWCRIALRSKTPIELAALCCVLVKIGAMDELDRVPQDYHLSCGYYLSRAGLLQKAEQFLSSGICFYEGGTARAELWRYYAELRTAQSRQGHWSEVDVALVDTLNTLPQKLDDGRYFFFERSGEHQNLVLTLASLRSDCLAANKLFLEAYNTIHKALGSLTQRGPVVLEPTRIASQVRLLNLQVELVHHAEAAETAIDLCQRLNEVPDTMATSPTTLWTVQEILACVDELLIHEEHYKQACQILRGLRQLTRSKDRPSTLNPSTDQSLPVATDSTLPFNKLGYIVIFPKDVCEYIEARLREVESIMDSAGIPKLWEPDQSIEIQSSIPIKGSPSSTAPIVSQPSKPARSAYPATSPILNEALSAIQSQKDLGMLAKVKRPPGSDPLAIQRYRSLRGNG